MFKILENDEPSRKSQLSNNARTGIFETAHGAIKTPTFMPVATKAYIKTVTPKEIIEMGTEVIIANSFLLYLRPGLEIIEHAGGIHNFMRWPRSIFTDSGGFQMIRPDFQAKVDSNGITFKSPFDGTKHIITPEFCIEIQTKLGVDVAMVLDHCPAFNATDDEKFNAVQNTTAWAKRSIVEKHRLAELSDDTTSKLPKIFGIVQGGVDIELRKLSAKSIIDLAFDGFGIGGLSIGESKEVMYEILKCQVPVLPMEKPRYLMGVGSPEDILESIDMGVDIFDSVFPTRNARHGTILTYKGNININRAKYAQQFELIDEHCNCYTCSSGFTRAYLNHLLKNYSILGMRLATVHNLHFIQELLQQVRININEGSFKKFKSEFLKHHNATKNNL